MRVKDVEFCLEIPIALFHKPCRLYCPYFIALFYKPFLPAPKKLLFFKSRPQQGARSRQPPPAPNRQSSAASNRQPASATQSQPEEPPSPTSSTTSSQFQKEIAEELASPKVLKAATKEASATKETSFKAATKETSSDTLNQVAGSIPKATAAAEKSNQATSAETEEMQIEAVPSTSETETANPPPKDTVMEESIRVTRGRLRKTRSAVNR